MYKINKLFVINDVIVIVKYYHFINELIMTKKSTTFNIKIDDKKFIFLRLCISMHKIRTVELIYRLKKQSNFNDFTNYM